MDLILNKMVHISLSLFCVFFLLDSGCREGSAAAHVQEDPRQGAGDEERDGAALGQVEGRGREQRRQYRGTYNYSSRGFWRMLKFVASLVIQDNSYTVWSPKIFC